MSKKVIIRCLNNGKSIEVPMGSTLLDIYNLLQLNMPYGPTSARVNNKVEGLHYVVFYNKDIEFLDITSPSGMRTYTRSLFFLLYKAVADLYPGGHISINTPISNGYFCTLYLGHEVTQDDVNAIHRRMIDLVKEGLPFHRITCRTEEAITLFEKAGMNSKVRLLKSCGSLYTNYYTLGDVADYYYGSLLINTNQIRLFDVVKYDDGLLLRLPNRKKPEQLQEIVKQEKMFEVFREHRQWQKILGVSTVGELNEACTLGHTNDIINVSEALQEKKISRLADEIATRPDVKVILISGPSSSGKTTFSKRLAVQLMASGLHPYAISLDEYFIDREKTPKDENGEYDFEALDALNIPMLSNDLAALLEGKEIELPRYNFQTGKSEKSGTRISISNHTILILEGIHALNPQLTIQIPDKYKFKIYTSALTTILLDDHNYIPTTDNRLLRRIVRDYKYRGYSATDTIRRWPSVRAGEEKWIFPYQENADAMFNSALLFEFAALREQALPLLEEVEECVPEYSEAYRLHKFLSYLKPMSINGLPPTSLLREFLGGSTFRY